jgi:hypothetical protein
MNLQENGSIVFFVHRTGSYKNHWVPINAIIRTVIHAIKIFENILITFVIR